MQILHTRRLSLNIVIQQLQVSSVPIILWIYYVLCVVVCVQCHCLPLSLSFQCVLMLLLSISVPGSVLVLYCLSNKIHYEAMMISVHVIPAFGICMHYI